MAASVPLLSRLGVRPGQGVAAAGLTDPDIVAALFAIGIGLFEPEQGADLDVFLFQAERIGDLEDLAYARDAMAPDGALWILWPKGRLDLSQVEVRRAARDVGLLEVKIANISARLNGIKFVLRP